MPEIGGDCLDIHAVLQRKCGIGVAEIMEAHFWQSKLGDNLLELLPDRVCCQVFPEFVGYCLWGYYLYKVELSRRQAMMIYFIGIVAFVAMVALPLLTNENVSFQYADPAPILAVFSVFLFAIRHPIKLPGKKGKVLTHFSKATFGIYMVHSFVVMETFSRLYRFLPNPVALIIVSTIGIFVLSYLIVLVIKQIPVLRDWVI